MFERTIGRQIQEADAVTDADVFFDEEEPAEDRADGAAVEAFKLFLGRLHCASSSAKSFTVLGYAALWHLDHPCFNGASQKEVAAIIGVNHEVFNRSVKQWAMILGAPSPKMRLRDGTRALLSSPLPLAGMHPLNPFVRLNTFRARRAGAEWLRRQLTLPLGFSFSFTPDAIKASHGSS